MIASPVLLDTAAMFDALMTDAAPPDVSVIQELHADSYDEVPFVSWKVSNSGQVEFGLWQVTLILTIVSEPRATFGICSHLYSHITGWNNPGAGVVGGVGGVTLVADGAVFDKTSEGVIHGKYLTQHSAAFTIQIREQH